MQTIEPELGIRAATIADVERKLEHHRLQMCECEAMLAILRHENLIYQDGRLQMTTAGQFKGMGIAEAMKSYLLFFRQDTGGVATLTEILRDLNLGGADLGQPDRQPRNIKITCSNNPRVFAYNEVADTVTLRPATGLYIEPHPSGKKKKLRKKRPPKEAVSKTVKTDPPTKIESQSAAS